MHAQRMRYFRRSVQVAEIQTRPHLITMVQVVTRHIHEGGEEEDIINDIHNRYYVFGV